MLRLGTAVWEPEIFPCSLENFKPRPACPHPGLWPEFFFHISKIYNISLEITTYDNKSDVWNKIYEDNLSGAIDTNPAHWVLTPERARMFDLVYPITQTKAVFVSKKDDPSLTIFASLPMSVFSIQMWIIVGFVVLIGVLGIKIANVVTNNRHEIKLWNFIRYAIGDPDGPLRHRSCAANILIILTGATYTVFTGVYAGTILTWLLIPQEQALFTDNDDLIQKIADRKLTLVQTSNVDYFAQEISSSDNPFFIALRNALKNNPAVIKSLEETFESIAEGPFVHATDDETAKAYMNCDLILSNGVQQNSKVFWTALLLPRNSSWTATLRHLINLERDYLDYLFRKYKKFDQLKCDDSRRRKSWQPLTLTELGGAFAFLASLSFVSFIACNLELGFKREFKIGASQTPSFNSIGQL